MGLRQYKNRCRALKGVAGRKAIPITKDLIINIYNHSISTKDKKRRAHQHNFSLATYYRRLKQFNIDKSDLQKGDES